MSHQLSTLVEGGRFFEGPRWHGGRWWVSDFYRHRVLALTTDGIATPVMIVAGQPSGLGWRPDGTLLVVSMRDRRLLARSPSGGVRDVADLSGLARGHCNDMVVDADGGAYVGCFGFDLMGGEELAPAVLIRVEVDGSARIVAEDLWFPNGMVITPDNRTLIVGETMGNRYTAFTIEEGGDLAGRRQWASLGDPPRAMTARELMLQATMAPDGCCLDAAGHIWSADAIGSRCVRLAPGGEITDEVAVPDGLGVFACMLGGDDGRTLLVCAAPDASEAKRAAADEAVLLTTTVEVGHAGRP